MCEKAATGIVVAGSSVCVRVSGSRVFGVGQLRARAGGGGVEEEDAITCMVGTMLYGRTIPPARPHGLA